jgi:hypothetical protein
MGRGLELLEPFAADLPASSLKSPSLTPRVLNPGSYWGTGGCTTQGHTLRRKTGVIHGDYNGYDAFDPAVEWDWYPQDTFDGLGSHP